MYGTGVRRRRWVLVVFGVLVLLLAGCGGSSGGPSAEAGPTTTDPPDPVSGGQLVYGTDAEADGWNPATSAWPPRAHTIARAVFDPIAIIDDNGDWAPYLAESITPNEDFTTWRITLRPGIEFQNGEPLDAEALKLHLDTLINGLVSSAAFVDVEATRTVGDLSVEVDVARPWTQFPSLLADQPGYVMAPEMIRAPGGGADRPIGTGPFVFDEWVRDSYIRLSRNPNYWQEGLPYLDSVEFRPLSDPNSQISALEAGDVDALISAAGGIVQRIDELEADPAIKVQRDDGPLAEAVIMFNLDTAIGGSLEVRQAVAQAVDKQQLVDVLYNGEFQVADQPYPPGDRFYTELTGPGFDRAAARAIVEEYEAENGPLELTLVTVASPDLLELSQLLQGQLGEIGIDVTIDSQEVVAFTRAFVTGEWEMILIGTFFRAADPDNEYHFMHSTSASDDVFIKLNFPRYRNDTVDAALDAARGSDDLAFRQAEYAKVWKAYAEDLPYIFLYHSETAALSRPDVFGLGTWTAPDGSSIPAVNGSAQWVTRAWLGE